MADAMPTPTRDPWAILEAQGDATNPPTPLR